MTSNSLSIKRRKHYANSLKSYWWLSLICTIFFLLIGPLVFGMFMDNAKHYVDSPELLVNDFHSWFELNGFIAFYMLAVFIAVIMGLVMFSYLHHKRQVNFYHSQPITRCRLFGQRYVLGIVLAMGPMLVVLLMMVVMAGFYGQDMGYALAKTMAHYGRMLLFLLLSYSLTILAGQLTGTVLTHFFMTAITAG